MSPTSPLFDGSETLPTRKGQAEEASCVPAMVRSVPARHGDCVDMVTVLVLTMNNIVTGSIGVLEIVPKTKTTTIILHHDVK